MGILWKYLWNNMRIQVIQPKENMNINIPVPLGLFINRLTCPILTRYANKYMKGYMIESNQLYRLCKCLNESKKYFGHYDLVDIQTSDGEIIKIII